MNRALLYRSDRRWQIWAGFAGAVLIHLGALALAEYEATAAPVAGVVDPGVDVLVVEVVEAPPPDPPVEMPDPLPPPITVVQSDFIDAATPPPKRQLAKSIAPLQKRVAPASGRVANMASARVFAVSAPRPEYPYEARRQRLTGSGTATLTIDPRTGRVLDVTMSRSTGSTVLDNAVISAFRRWRFKPGTISKVQTPITFTLTGASY